ncbi:MAG: hypothetical protein ACREBZ_05175 [Thermoplasmata archaeon]
MVDPYTQLLELRRSESAARGLAKISRDFYPTTTGYLAETRRAYESDLREDPSSRRGEISRNTHQRASQAARDIVEARMAKLLSAAFQASVGGARELPNAVPEERALFDRLVESLTAYRRSSAPYLEGVSILSPVGEPASRPPAVDAVAAPPVAPAVEKESPPGPAVRGFRYVRIVRDSRALQLGKETIDLRREDILSVSAETAHLLVSSKLAEPVEPSGPGPVT